MAERRGHERSVQFERSFDRLPAVKLEQVHRILVSRVGRCRPGTTGHKHITRKLLWFEYETAHPDGYEFTQVKLLLSRCWH